MPSAVPAGFFVVVVTKEAAEAAPDVAGVHLQPAQCNQTLSLHFLSLPKIRSGAAVCLPVQNTFREQTGSLDMV